MALDVDGIIAQLKDASILELNDLVKSIEDEFGVKAAAPVAAGAAAGADAAAAKDTYDVELTEAGQEKVKVIKAVREITGLGLKALAQRLPSNNLAPSSNKSISLNRGDTAKGEMLFLYIKRPKVMLL